MLDILKYRLAELIYFVIQSDLQENNNQSVGSDQQFMDRLWSGSLNENNFLYLESKIPNLKLMLQLMDPSLLPKNEDEEQVEAVVAEADIEKKKTEDKIIEKTAKVSQELLALALIFTAMIDIIPEEQKELFTVGLNKNIESAFVGNENKIKCIKDFNHDLCNAKSSEETKQAIEKVKLSEVLTDEEIKHAEEGNIIETQIFNIAIREVAQNSNNKKIDNQQIKSEVNSKVEKIKKNLASRLNQKYRNEENWQNLIVMILIKLLIVN